MVKKVDFSKTPEADIIVESVYQRQRKGLGTTIFAIGLSGTGKSSVSQRLGELISERIHGEVRFNVNNIVDNLVNLLGFVRSVKDFGEVVVVEEVSVLFPSRRAMAKDNVAIGKIMDTIRKKQIILIANAPLLLSMDSHMRAMGNILIETLRINKTEKVVISKALRLQTNPRSGKTYLHRFQRKGREVHRIFTRMPNIERWKAYEERKDKFMDELYERLKFETEKKDMKVLKDMGKIKPVRPLTANEVMAYQLVTVKGMTHKEASKLMNLSTSRVSDIISSVKKKTKLGELIDQTRKRNEQRRATS